MEKSRIRGSFFRPRGRPLTTENNNSLFATDPVDVTLLAVTAESKPGHKALRRGRHSLRHGIYFVTVVTHDRKTWFSDHETARLISRLLNGDKTWYDARVLCWVAMPDHVHFLVQLGREPLEKIVNQWKSKSARMINREIGRTGRFWAPGYYDHGLRQEESVRDVARYIIGNPLRAGLTRKYGDYPYWNAVWL